MNKEAMRTLTKCDTLLREYEERLSAFLRVPGQNNNIPALTLQQGFNFGRETISAIKTLLAKGNRYDSFACMLCRPYFEMAARLLWATRAESGWPRLAIYYAKEDTKWAKSAAKIKSMPSMAELAKQLLAKRVNFLERLDDEHGDLPSAPTKMEKILQEIKQQDIQQGVRETDKGFVEFSYTNVYRILCRLVHGHISVASRKLGVTLPYTKVVPAMATRDLLKAFSYVACKEPEKEIRIIEERMIELSA